MARNFLTIGPMGSWIIMAVMMVLGGLEVPEAQAFDPNFQFVQDVVAIQPASIETAVVDCNPIDQYIPDNIDMSRVRAAWLDWNNGLRSKAGLAAYEMEPQLSWSAQNWSDRAKRLGVLNHKRDGQTAYYDYWKILAWFKNLGLEFKTMGGVTMTENIGWGYYKCPADGSDCTDAINSAVRTTFDFFLSEKGKAYDVHYRSLMHPSFKQIGFGLALDRQLKKYYLTIHYGTEITSNPKPICGF
jgi:uncharacterized protein YkwD